MIDVLSVENMRESDAATIATKIPSKELMMRAAKGIFDSVKWKGPVAIICGSGNNAGDGYALATLMNDAGIDCSIILIGEKFSEDGRYYFERCQELGSDIKRWNKDIDLSVYGTVVDCILGTGFKGKVREDIRSVIEKINESGAYIVSADINSGLNGDSGIADVCVRSDLTISIGSYKAGHFLNMAKDVIKEKVNCDIGIKPVKNPYKLVERADINGWIPERKNFSNKGTYGYTALIGGSKRYSGAIRLAYLAAVAMRSGAGVVKAALPDFLYHDVASHILESTIFPLSDDGSGIRFVEEEIRQLISNVKTVAFGMGIGVSKETKRLLLYLLKNYKGKLIIDADGLTLLSDVDKNIIREAECEIVLTPHIKEFSRLTDMSIESILEDPIRYALEYAKDTKTTVLLKGPSTVVTNGNEVYITDKGCPGMTTAGSGDVLSGILAAVCAYIPNIARAAAAGAYINGLAGEISQEKFGSISMTASDTAANIAGAINSIGGES
ncbi:MAG: NAD(P)H-hydrate dehydratase [Lachnospiraceae bacterium]|nr:NAD(P)H-hydrate dehydratase [Lachnospiraceae bacterium]